LDPKHQQEAFAQAKRFFDLPMEKKLEVDTKLVPNEYVGYHPMMAYSRDGRKEKGA
jgi:isopenicillin N synthase-like dioxygenase